LKDARLRFIASDSPAFGLPAVLAPCCPNRIVLTLSPTFATTIWDFFGWPGVRFGLLNPATFARAKRGSFSLFVAYLFLPPRLILAFRLVNVFTIVGLPPGLPAALLRRIADFF